MFHTDRDKASIPKIDNTEITGYSGEKEIKTMINKTLSKCTTGLLMGLMLLLLISNVRADSLTVNITNGAYIQNPRSNQGRLLIKFDLPSRLASEDIEFAELLIPLTAVIPDSSVLAIYCLPLRIPWDPSDVSWEDLGDSLSADIVVEQSSLYSTSTGGFQGAYFNISEIVKSWQDSIFANHGLILYCEQDKLPYFNYTRRDGSPFGNLNLDFKQ